MPFLSPFPPPPPLSCIFPKEGLRLSSYPINFAYLTSFAGLTENVHFLTCKIITDWGGGGGDFDIKVTGMLVVSLRVVIADFSLT